MNKRKFNKKWLIPIALLLGVSLVGSGVFASSQITLNSGSAVSLGTGAAAVNVCGSQATISAQQYFNTNTQTYYTGTISLANLDTTACNGKTLSMAYKNPQNSTVYSATWPISSSNSTYYWAYSATSSTGSQYSNSALSAFDTALTALTTIAVSVS